MVRPQVARPQVGRPQVVRPQVARPQVVRPQVGRPQVERRVVAAMMFATAHAAARRILSAAARGFASPVKCRIRRIARRHTRASIPPATLQTAAVAASSAQPACHVSITPAS